MKIGVIGGHRIPGLIKNSEKIIVETTFGNVPIELSKFGEHEIFFISRHGEKANIPPHNINHRANIQAFSASHVENIFSVGTVGSMNKAIQPGDFVIPHDFIDFTKSRPLTFFEDSRIHVDMTDPFCPALRKLLVDSCKKIGGIAFHEKGAYLSTEGPRLETASEIKLFSNFADIVGMIWFLKLFWQEKKAFAMHHFVLFAIWLQDFKMSYLSMKFRKCILIKNLLF